METTSILGTEKKTCATEHRQHNPIILLSCPLNRRIPATNIYHLPWKLHYKQKQCSQLITKKTRWSDSDNRCYLYIL